MANTYDIYQRSKSTDPGQVVENAAPAAGLVPTGLLIIKVPYTAGAGTALDIQVTAPQKVRIVDAAAMTVTGVMSSVLQVFTASGGGGSAATSSLATASAGVARNALTTATQTFAKDAIIYCRQSGGATLAGGELYLYCLPET